MAVGFFRLCSMEPNIGLFATPSGGIWLYLINQPAPTYVRKKSDCRLLLSRGKTFPPKPPGPHRKKQKQAPACTQGTCIPIFSPTYAVRILVKKLPFPYQTVPTEPHQHAEGKVSIIRRGGRSPVEAQRNTATAGATWVGKPSPRPVCTICFPYVGAARF